MFILGVGLILYAVIIGFFVGIVDDNKGILKICCCSLLFGILLIVGDLNFASLSKYKITEQIITNKYSIDNQQVFFEKPVLITVYEKDCSDFIVWKNEYKYIIVGEAK